MRLCKWLITVGLFVAPLLLDGQSSQPSEDGSYGFQELRLGTTLTQFKSKRRSQICSASGQTVTRCDYTQQVFTVTIGISAFFVDGKLGLIQVKPPYDSYYCFGPPPKDGAAAALFPTACAHIQELWKSLTETLGTSTTIGDASQDGAYAMRWESSIGIAQFEPHMCGPWNGAPDAWGAAVSELLIGHFCGQGDSLSYRQPTMFYVDKRLGRTLAKSM